MVVPVLSHGGSNSNDNVTAMTTERNDTNIIRNRAGVTQVLEAEKYLCDHAGVSSKPFPGLRGLLPLQRQERCLMHVIVSDVGRSP